MTVRDNLAFGLAVRGHARREIDARVDVVAESLGIAALLDRKPSQLSGGQRQRVALGRAIVREPLAFLFDEPLSNLDARLRVETRAELARLHRRLTTTMVYVTHDQVESMTLGTRVAVMHEGRLQQVAPPMTLYREPANLFVAGFIGSPAMKLVPGRVVNEEGVHRFVGAGLTLTIPALSPTQPNEVAGDVVLGIRPQRLSLAAPDAPSAWRGSVWLVESHGDSQVIHLEMGEVTDLVVVVSPDHPARAGDVVGVVPEPTGFHLFDAASGRTLRSTR
jgi:multiple sugar transport system ATP-binding protein